MTVVTADRLGAQVGAEVSGIDRDRLLHDDALPAWTLSALDRHGALVFRVPCRRRRPSGLLPQAWPCRDPRLR